VVLLRDGAGGIETWLLTRVAQMAFAAGMSVFPGGRVDAADVELPLAGADTARIAERFGCDESTARSLVGAAARETFEEAGVLLTAPPAELAEHRFEVESGRLPFGELLRSHDLAIDAGALRPWARWVTPAGESRRYDTRFFVGALPDGARAQNVTSESSAAEWVRVSDALAEAHRGDRLMLPPTVMTMASIAAFGTVAEVLAAAEHRSLETVRPVVRVGADGRIHAELPDGTSVTLPRPAGAP
jgi:8-oxo-dGTP pyrophosphatase MutT (NUDIX family)